MFLAIPITYEFRVDALEAAGPDAEHARPNGLHAEALAQLVDVDLAVLVRRLVQDPRMHHAFCRNRCVIV